jgi:Skp family chaperone for outer membrane proteins
MKNLLLAAAALTVVASPAFAQTAAAPAAPAAVTPQPVAPARVVMVNLNQIFAASDAGKAAFTELENRATTARSQYQSQGVALKNEQDAILKQRDVIDAAAFDQRAKAWQDKANAYQADFAKKEEDLRSTRENIIQQLTTAVSPVIREEMEQRGANIAIDRNTALLVSPAIDVTTSVLAKLNTRLRSVQVVPLPTQAPAGAARPATPAPAPATPPRRN